MSYIKADGIHEATHWIPREDASFNSEDTKWLAVTLDKCYELIYEKIEDEICIKDDLGRWSLAYMAHSGEFVISQ